MRGKIKQNKKKEENMENCLTKNGEIIYNCLAEEKNVSTKLCLPHILKRLPHINLNLPTIDLFQFIDPAFC